MDGLELVGVEEVPEAAVLADTWWCGNDSLIAVYRGGAEVMDAPQCTTTTIYAGLDTCGLRGVDDIVMPSK